jgi:hypothetical protein
MIKLNDAVWTPAGRFGEVVEFSNNGKQALVRYIGQGRYLPDWIYISTLTRKPTTELPCDHCEEIMPSDELISIDPEGECEVCDTCYDKLL